MLFKMAATFVLFTCLFYKSSAQLNLTTNQSAVQLVQHLVGNGITVNNEVLVCDSTVQSAKFTAINTNLGIDSGILLTSGSVITTSNYFGVSGPSSIYCSSDPNPNSADPDLAALVNTTTANIKDACKLEFDFVSVGDTVRFDYVFASEEYPYFNCSEFNDVFGFFISGPGISGNSNLALIPGTTIPVAINSVNNGVATNLTPCTSMGPGSPFTNYYVDNSLSTTIAYNGFTQVFTAIAHTVPCSTYHIKLAIGDKSDAFADSGVFIEKGSLTANTIDSSFLQVTDASDALTKPQDYIIEGCMPVNIQLDIAQPKNYPIDLNLVWSGTATNGVDYPLQGSIKTIPANTTKDSIFFLPVNDFVAEGIETISLKIYYTTPCSNILFDSVLINISDSILLDYAPIADTICPGDTVQLASNCDSAINISWSPVNTLSAPNADTTYAFPSVSTTYSLTASYKNCPQLTADIPINILDFSMANITDADCYGTSTGSINVQAVNGTPAYTYSLNGGTAQSSGTFSGLAAASYIVTAIDANGCMRDTVLTLSQPSAVMAQSVTTSPATCNTNNGSVTIVGTGGTSGYTYAQGSGAYQNSGAFTGLAAGSYVFHIKDANDCIYDTTISISAPNIAQLDSLVSLNPLCHGGSGSVTVYASGGPTPYSYSINGGTAQSSNVFSPISAGTYTVTVTDANGCIATGTTTIAEPSAIAVSTASIINADCHGASTGSISVTASGGTAPLTYSLNGGTPASSGTYTGLTAATYTLQVTDNLLCTYDTTFTIYQPDELIVDTISTVNVSCNGGNNGSIDITAIGGTAPYTYTLGLGSAQSSGLFSGLSAGTYTISIVDANGCQTDTTISVTAPGPLQISTISQNHALCHGDSTGSITVTVSGGTPVYAYSLNGGTASTNNTFSTLPAGTYTINVEDAQGCQIDSTVVVTEPPLFVISSSGTDPLCHGDSNGQVIVTATTGIVPITYSYNGSIATSSNTLSNLPNGTYTIEATDANGCIALDTVMLTEPAEMLIGLSIIPISCYGASDGQISFTVANGSPPISTSLNGSPMAVSNFSYAALDTGSYTLTIQDSTGCTKDTNFIITQPVQITFQLQGKDLSCYGAGDGEITVTGITGGLTPYNFIVNGSIFSSTPTITQLDAGSHQVTVVDANGCQDSQVVVLNEPDRVKLNINIIDPECTTLGAAYLQALGGTAPYTYYLDAQVQLNTHFSNIDSGKHTIRVEDDRGCGFDTSIYFEPPLYPQITDISIQDPLCYGDQNGSLSISVDSTNPPYIYSIDTSIGFQSGPSFYGLSDGEYHITVRDQAGCENYETVEITQPEELSVELAVENNNCATTEQEGRIEVFASGGVPPYTYLWNHQTADTTIATDLRNGSYRVTVLDNNGCSTLSIADITETNCCKPFIPNAFSPNNDGKNDYLKIYNLDEMDYLKVRIFNRYGQEIYYGYNELYWDGRFNGKPLDIGVYQITVIYHCRGWGGKNLEYKGEVHLLR